MEPEIHKMNSKIETEIAGSSPEFTLAV